MGELRKAGTMGPSPFRDRVTKLWVYRIYRVPRVQGLEHHIVGT